MTALAANRFRLADLRKAIRPFRLHWFPTLGSTNDKSAEMRRRGDLYAPAIVLTGRQTSGRGRGGHAWWSRAPGCLTVTFVLPIDDQLLPHQIPLLAGVAVRDAAAHLSASRDVTLKWPNDILHKGRKLGGLLCERVSKVDLIGLGLNVNLDPSNAPRDLRNQITAVSEIAGSTIDITDALATVASQLHRLWSRGAAGQPFGSLLQEYDQHHALVGRRVSVVNGSADRPISGRCEGLDDMGRLLLRSGKTLHRVVSGHVQVI